MTRRDAHPHNLTLAVGIAEWATALDHLVILKRLGQGPGDRTLAAIEREFMHLCRIWRTAVHEEFSSDDLPTIVTEARTYVTQHQAEVDALLTDRGVST
jgi:hypothetical protein